MYKKVNKFAILGAGNGGQAMAAYLALQGYEVNLYNRSFERIKEIKEAAGIYLKGVFKGFGHLNKITTDIEEAIEGVEVIMVVTPAVAHKYLAELSSPHLKDGQIIVLNPGRTGGALEFKTILDKNNCKADIILSEAQTFLYASRVTGPAEAKIFGVKNKVSIAAFPSYNTRDVIEKLAPVFPQFTPVENILKTSMDNIGAIFHPAPILLNMAWIESTGGKFDYYQQGITPSVAKILEKVDEERVEIASTIGVDALSAGDWLRMAYGAQGKDLYELLQYNKQYKGISAPHTINHRYIFEDVPMSLVPMASLGDMTGIKTPTIDMVVNIANIVHDKDYWKEGRTVESLGLSGLTISKIKNLVNKGYVEEPEILPGLKKSIFRKVDHLVLDKLSERFHNEGGIET